MMATALAHTIKIKPSVSVHQNRQAKLELNRNRTKELVGVKFNIKCQGLRTALSPSCFAIPKKDLVKELGFKNSFGNNTDLDSHSSFVTSSSRGLHARVKARSVSVKQGGVTGSGGGCVAMLERFSEKGFKVIQIAQEEAIGMGYNYVGTEHILLGLIISEETSIVGEVFKSMGINIKDARAEVEKIIGKGRGFFHVEMRFTPRLKRVLEFSLEKARELGHNYIGPEDLLFGLLCEGEGEGVAVRVLENFGVDLNTIRTQVLRMLSETPLLDKYGINLTKLAKEGKLDPVAGRQQQIGRVIDILARHTKNNPCLIGEPGVGKTAVVKGLAQQIADGNVPETVEGKKVIRLDMDFLLAGTRRRDDIEERLKKVMEEIKQSAKIVLFIDAVHTLTGTGASEGAIDAASIFQSALVRGEFQCIGTTTIDEYRKHIEKDPAFGRLFNPVKVPEPSVDESIQILKALREQYEIHHKLHYTDEALVAAVQLSHHYISDRLLPDKAIDLIDEAGSRVRHHRRQDPKELEKELRQISEDKIIAFQRRDAIEMEKLKFRELNLMEKIRSFLRKGKESELAGDLGPIVTEIDIQHTVSELTGIPVDEISS